MIGFQLGREYKLSVAEILAVFPKGKTVYLSTDFLILDGLDKTDVLEKANNLGGTIKIVEIVDSSVSKEAEGYEGKFKYGVSIFGEKKNLKSILVGIKKELKDMGVSSRFVNKDFQNLSSAQILGEKLLKSNSDYNLIFLSLTMEGASVWSCIKEDKLGNYFFGKTIWIQDIFNYSKRDYEKDRDMQTGMLPPKLCQMMINISSFQNPSSSVTSQGLTLTSNEEGSKEKIIYDPFVGLGTVLIESILMGNKSVYGSDLNEKMVEHTKNNIVNFCKNEDIKLENFEIIKLNAKFIDESEFFDKGVTSIVTEGYLGEVMTQNNISIERIDKQKKSLLELYDRFFEGLKKIDYSGNLVICFPFWEMKGKYIYFTEIYDLLSKNCTIESMFPIDFSKIVATKAGSLLYKRDKQLVGREIFKLKIKA
ncbi:MAG: hypothetical protein PHS49_03385 [Candidatus Gracilibacteria bacterium]|nr:hypothetical protein [Candidatus Gracilibacteria bacterium]